jgi:hypothetical protein
MGMADVHQITPFVWNAKRERAAILVAEDDFSDHVIAKTCGVTKKTLENWKQHPDFRGVVGDHVGQIQAAMLKLAIAKKHKRLAVLDELHTKSMQVVALRAAKYGGDADTAEQAARRIFGNHVVPEAATGLLVKKESVTSSGMVVTEWQVDTALMKEIRALQEQAAKELGQWIEKSEQQHTGMSFADLYTLVAANENGSPSHMGRSR